MSDAVSVTEINRQQVEPQSSAGPVSMSLATRPSRELPVLAVPPAALSAASLAVTAARVVLAAPVPAASAGDEDPNRIPGMKRSEPGASGGPPLRDIPRTKATVVGRQLKRVSRPIGAGGIADHGQGSRSYSRRVLHLDPCPWPALGRARRRDGIPASTARLSCGQNSQRRATCVP